MDLQGKKVGIWGYGIVGKAVCAYLQTQPCTLSICDQREFTPQESLNLRKEHIQCYPQSKLDLFLASNDYIIPSPGIDISRYTEHTSKWICELDLFASNWSKPIIAITGTTGKTTVTHIIRKVFEQLKIPIATGGNIGIGMLSLLNQKKSVNYALLEVSSWQLQYSSTFAPQIALWTNFSANHLDRHGTMKHYFDAKYQIIAYQKATDYAVVPLELMQKIYAKHPASCCIFFSEQLPKKHIKLRAQDFIVYYHKGGIYKKTSEATVCISQKISLPMYSFTQNWIMIIVLLDLLKLPILSMHKIDPKACELEHRLEFVGTYNGALVYNDSKSTTPASTVASVKKFGKRKIHLLLGGLSKSINRKPLIQSLQKNNIVIYCFGKEANYLHALCKEQLIQSYSGKTLEIAVSRCKKNCQQGDIILLSPAGSSFDLFEDYQERGNVFKALFRLL